MKDLGIGHDLDLAVLEILRAGLRGHDHVPRIPGDRVTERIIARLWGGHPASVRGKVLDDPALFLDLVNEPHGRHVIDAGVDAHLTQEGDVLFFGLRVKLLDRLGQIRSRDHVRVELDADLGHLGLEHGRQEVDDNLGVLHQVADHLEVHGVHVPGLPARVPVDAGFGQRLVPVRHRDSPVVVFGVLQKVPDEVRSALTGPQHENRSHVDWLACLEVETNFRGFRASNLT